MKRILALLPVFLLLFISAQAQRLQTTETQTPQERAHSSAMRMKKVLELNDAQTTQVEAVILSRIQAIDRINADASLTPEAKEAAIQKVRTDKDAELQKILTPQQYTRYQEMKNEREQSKNASGGK